MRRFLSALVVSLCLSSLSVAVAQIRGPVEVVTAVQHDVSSELRNVRPVRSQSSQHARPLYRIPHALGPSLPDPVVQTQAGATATPGTAQNFDGVGRGFAGPQGSFTVDAAPPDTNGAVGATQYVQWVNE